MNDGVRLVVNASLCDGHGICVLRCPELITLDQWGFAAVESRTVTDQRTVRQARRAAAACPRRALTVVVVPLAPTTPPVPHLVALPSRASDEAQRKNNAPLTRNAACNNDAICTNKELARVHNRDHEGR